MSIKTHLINIEDAITELKNDSAIFIDVRSQNEFLEDHIPSAINMPILDNEERHIVGYTYKQESQDKAYELGWQIFSKKIAEFEKIVKSCRGKKIIFYCARGGFRSGCFVEHFEKNNILVYKLERGYKAFREYIRNNLESIELPKKAFIIYGLTGCGKTRLIKKLQNSIDLEGIAQHRSSTFGAVGLKPKSQKFFETQLFFELLKKRPYIVFEGESRKIGDIVIPINVFDSMQKATKINVVCSDNTRAQRTMDEYFDTEEKIQQIRNVLLKLTAKIGKKKIEELTKLIDEKKYFEFTKEMLLNYYDPLYKHFVKDIQFAVEFDCEDLDKCAKEIDEFCSISH